MRYHIKADPRIHCKKLDELIDYPAAAHLTGEFTEELAFAFRQQLLSAEAIAMKSKQKLLPITIDSFGGDVYALFSCIDAIKAIDPSITVATIVIGKAMSAGAILATCGHTGFRFMAPNSTIMYHTASGGASGTVEDMAISVDEAKRLNEKLLRIGSQNLGKKAGFLEKFLKDANNTDVYIDADKALELGIVDHVGIPKFDIQISYDIITHMPNGDILDICEMKKKKKAAPELPKSKQVEEEPEEVEQPKPRTRKKKTK